MEVNIALLIMAIGLLGLLSLFPVGLRQGDAASSDTIESAFADLVLNAMRANAQTVTNWNDWLTLTNGNLLVLGQTTPTDQNVQPITVPTVKSPAPGGVKIILGSGTELWTALGDGYLVPGQYLKYALHMEPASSDPTVVRAWIQITTRRYTDVTKAPIYATSFVYMGM